MDSCRRPSAVRNLVLLPCSQQSTLNALFSEPGDRFKALRSKLQWREQCASNLISESPVATIPSLIAHPLLLRPMLPLSSNHSYGLPGWNNQWCAILPTRPGPSKSPPGSGPPATKNMSTRPGPARFIIIIIFRVKYRFFHQKIIGFLKHYELSK
jgi:hypothetical protein